MTLLTVLVLTGGVVLGWIAHDRKDKIKKWLQNFLRKSNEKVKNL